MLEKNGIRVKYFPDKVVVGAMTEKGLTRLTGLSYDEIELRDEFCISKNEWPLLNLKKLMTGEVFLIIFTKE